MTYQFDPIATTTTLKRFLTGSLNQSGLSGYVIGLSGGIDSALSATLAVAAVGAEKVYGLLMPYQSSSEASVTDATAMATQLGIERATVDITPMIDAYYKSIPEGLRLRAGNKMARERMSILFDIAAERDSLVLGTGNRTEIALGYTTIFGDSACSVDPLGELYKTEVRTLAQHLGLPESIITKAPTADLWADQTDEGEIGVTYEEIDAILRAMLDEEIVSIAALGARGHKATAVSRVVSLLNRNAFKRTPPPIAPLGKSAIPNSIQLQP